MLRVSPMLSIDDAALSEQFVRASGPGGQNVNKVSTAVELRLDLRLAGLPEDIERRLVALAGRKVSADRVIVILADRFRSQARNREDARDRLLEMLREAEVPPRVRRRTRVPRSAKRARREGKAHRSQVKSLRSKQPGHED